MVIPLYGYALIILDHKQHKPLCQVKPHMPLIILWLSPVITLYGYALIMLDHKPLLSYCPYYNII